MTQKRGSKHCFVVLYRSDSRLNFASIMRNKFKNELLPTFLDNANIVTYT
jgi:hypothetical protein